MNYKGLINLFRATGKTTNLKKRLDQILETEPEATINIVVATDIESRICYREYINNRRISFISLDRCDRIIKDVDPDQVMPIYRYGRFPKADYILIESDVYEKMLYDLLGGLDKLSNMLFELRGCR